MTGLALALASSELGFSVEIVDSRPMQIDEIDSLIASQRATDFDSRVSALTLASEQLLRNLGVWPQIQAWGAEGYTRMHVWDAETRGEVSFDANEVHQAVLGHIVENRWVMFALLKAALKDSGIKISFGTKISKLSSPSQGVRELELSDQTNRTAKLVVGADGAHSQTRKLAGLGTHEWDYGQDALVATLYTEHSHQHCCWQSFTSDGPLALLPLAGADQRAVSLVWSTSPDHASQLQACDEQVFCEAITQASKSVLGSIKSATGVQSIRLRQRHAQQYVTDNFALVGDAAHTIHPLAGQGVNLGFQDVGALVDHLQRASARNASIGDLNLLKRYQRARQLENLKMSALMEVFKRLFEPQPAIVELGRSLGMQWVNRSGPLKNHIIEQAMGLNTKASRLLKVNPGYKS